MRVGDVLHGVEGQRLVSPGWKDQADLTVCRFGWLRWSRPSGPRLRSEGVIRALNYRAVS